MSVWWQELEQVLGLGKPHKKPLICYPANACSLCIAEKNQDVMVHSRLNSSWSFGMVFIPSTDPRSEWDEISWVVLDDQAQPCELEGMNIRTLISKSAQYCSLDVSARGVGIRVNWILLIHLIFWFGLRVTLHIIQQPKLLSLLTKKCYFLLLTLII